MTRDLRTALRAARTLGAFLLSDALARHPCKRDPRILTLPLTTSSRALDDTRPGQRGPAA